ncbi:uncharacterized protein L969DRAFT_84047 [Mixia osmundae IAM 14324]|uniref:Mitochondrial carrier protein n=1 Tax=Mixia osmundae (strain CBS 9802 / IAM 14324 / JCM 22182 / KY 12970) TaxID=764103 RepID=G7E023_MIXOS|nr:uncharacterized protein L969DRAFT_84047 [Mixia osmundae IAM 14324]KEI42176.1 hypothetical protein L969DRAFT_84047 [Mixia osmundae IAM 14324]GAA96183.1 hypothetical protein E5Q_02847 [Mixia osmundae IAM 14324]
MASASADKTLAELLHLDPAVLVGAAASGIIARTICHPLDTMRIRIQTAKGSTLPPLRELLPTPRIRLYAGLPVALAVGVPALTAYLSVFEGSKSLIMRKVNPDDSLIHQLPIFVTAAIMAQLSSAVIWTPLDVLKSRLQAGRDGTSALNLLVKIYKTEKLRGFYRGYLMSTALFGPQLSAYWTCYEILKKRLIPGYSTRTSNAPPASKLGLTETELMLRYMASSSIACATAVTLTNPLDAVTARLQTSGGRYGGVRNIVKYMWTHGGLSAFTRGIKVRIAYAIPSNTISMLVYEQVKRKWKRLDSE